MAPRLSDGQLRQQLLTMESMYETFAPMARIAPESETASVVAALRSEIVPLRTSLRLRGVPLGWKSEFTP